MQKKFSSLSEALAFYIQESGLSKNRVGVASRIGPRQVYRLLDDTTQRPRKSTLERLEQCLGLKHGQLQYVVQQPFDCNVLDKLKSACDVLRYCRTAQYRAAKEICLATRIDERQVFRYESGTSIPGRTWLKAAARFYGLPRNYFDRFFVFDPQQAEKMTKTELVRYVNQLIEYNRRAQDVRG